MIRGMLLLCCCVLFACNAVDIQEKTSYQFQNNTLSADVWNAIEAGVTNRQWLLQHIGAPTSVEENSETQLYTYRYEALTHKRKRVILLYQNQKTSITVKVHSVELKNGIVVAHQDITPRGHTALLGSDVSENTATAEPSQSSEKAVNSNDAVKSENETPSDVESLDSELPSPLNRDL